MATIEVTSITRISIYEMADHGHGIDIEVGRDEAGRWGIWAGPRGQDAGARCLGDVGDVELPLDLAQAMTVVGEAEGWRTVKVNGSIVWSSEAAQAVKDALDLPGLDGSEEEAGDEFWPVG